MENELHVPDGDRCASQMSGLAAHLDDILNHPHLTKAEKRAVLASWASDARAVEGAPALRQLDSGAVVDVRDIIQALKSLDEPEPLQARESRWALPVVRQRMQPRRPHGMDQLQGKDDDDDPPPCPALAALPVKMSFVRACSEYSNRGVRLRAVA